MSKSATPDDAGLSLVELVAYLSLAILVLTALTSVFLSASQTQAATKNRDIAAGTAQVAVNSLQTSIRNASGFSVSGNLLRARVAVGNAGDWQCQAWALNSGKLYLKKASTAIAAPTDYTGWTTLATGVTGTLSSGSTAVPFLNDGSSGVRLKYGFIVRAGSGGSQASVPVEGGAVAQAKGSGSPATCW